MPSTSRPVPREMSAEEFVRREEEKYRAIVSGLRWMNAGAGRWFYSNAIRYARPEQIRQIVAARKRPLQTEKARAV